jgi:hypothetical protein
MDNPFLTAKKCPYCNDKPKLIDSVEIYGTSYGMAYYCAPCDALVNCHKGTTKPLGRLANKELRYWKRVAHEHFDPLWKKAIEKGRTKKEARGAAYKWLAKQMNLDIELCHVGMFDIEQCKKVIELCKPYM